MLYRGYSTSKQIESMLQASITVRHTQYHHLANAKEEAAAKQILQVGA